MMPFDRYPGGGQELLGRCAGANCRHEYGLKLQRLTGQASCAYCGLSLVDTYEHWLLMSVDHVIPTRTGTAMGLKREWLEDFANTVLCCAACNGFGNRFKLAPPPPAAAEFADFVSLRDLTFRTRAALIADCQRREKEFYASQPWRIETSGVSR